MSTEPTVLIPADVTRIDRAGYGVIGRVYTAMVPQNGAPARPMKVMIDLKRDFYDYQSHFIAKVWTDSGWQVVTVIAPEAPEMAALPKLPSRWEDDHEACKEAIEAVVDRLVHQAYRILRP